MGWVGLTLTDGLAGTASLARPVHYILSVLGWAGFPLSYSYARGSFMARLVLCIPVKLYYSLAGLIHSAL
jgi:hypothetical protein